MFDICDIDDLGVMTKKEMARHWLANLSKQI